MSDHPLRVLVVDDDRGLCEMLRLVLELEGLEVVTVDVSRRPELARKYGVALVPTAVAVSSTGAVLARLAG